MATQPFGELEFEGTLTTTQQPYYREPEYQEPEYRRPGTTPEGRLYRYGVCRSDPETLWLKTLWLSARA